jgi:hypothetical protein
MPKVVILSILTLLSEIWIPNQVMPQMRTDPRVPITNVQNIMALICLSCNLNGTSNCYWSTECSSGSYCSYNGCTLSGKKDGVCTKSAGGFGDWGDFISAIDFYFQAYKESAEGKGGLPDLDLVRRAQDKQLTAEGHYAVQLIVYNTLDLALGFDFIRPQACIGSAEEGKIPPGGLGQIRLAAKDAPPGAVEFIELLQHAVVNAVKAKNPNLVADPIRSFWKKHPDYKPRHTGRCWPHGHTDLPYKTAEECQIKELTHMLNVFLPKSSGEK